jgi:hypothetical protein
MRLYKGLPTAQRLDHPLDLSASTCAANVRVRDRVGKTEYLLLRSFFSFLSVNQLGQRSGRTRYQQSHSEKWIFLEPHWCPYKNWRIEEDNDSEYGGVYMTISHLRICTRPSAITRILCARVFCGPQ